MSPLGDGRSQRESPLGVARKWLPWCLGLIFALTAGWTALIAWAEVSSRNHEGIAETAIAVVSAAAPASPLILIYAILTIGAIDVMGGLTIVTARYLGDKFVKPLIEKRRAEGRGEASGRRPGRRAAQVDRLEPAASGSRSERRPLRRAAAGVLSSFDVDLKSLHRPEQVRPHTANRRHTLLRLTYPGE